MLAHALRLLNSRNAAESVGIVEEIRFSQGLRSRVRHFRNTK